MQNRPVEKYMCYFGTNPMKFECAIKMKWWKMWNRPVEKYLWQFWNKSNRKWVHWESGHLWGAARSALATFWIDLHKFGQCKRLSWHTAQGIELCHVGLQCIFMMLGAVEEKLPALEGFGSPTNIYVSRGTWLLAPHRPHHTKIWALANQDILGKGGHEFQ